MRSSKAIVAALKLKLLPAEKKAIEQRGTSNADAYNLYLMARQIWISGNYGDVGRDEIVIRTAQRAIEARSRLRARPGHCLQSLRRACATITAATSTTGWQRPKKR